MTFFPSLAYLVVFIFGLIFGSFFNVLIHRIPKSIQSPKKESLFSAISFPKSYCPKCKKGLFVVHNLPIISWLFLLGKCYFCKAKISIRYPLIELLSGLIFLYCFCIPSFGIKKIFVFGINSIHNLRYLPLFILIKH